MRVIRFVLVLAVVVVSIGVMPLSAQALSDITCNEVLFVTVTLNPAATVDYRLVGNGPGLPTESQLVQGNPSQSITSTISFALPGPGTWSGIVLEYRAPGYDWFPSGFNGDLTQSCDPIGCVAFVDIPSQAVGGTFNSDSEIYWAPGQVASNTPTITAGSSYLVAGQDATGMYRKVLISCQWVWVRAETVGPNYEAPWNGKPLPTTVVE